MRLLKYSLICATFLLLAACGGDNDPTNDLIVGVMSGPEEQLMQVARKTAIKNFGVDIKIVSFSDYNMPNRALCEGSLNANIFQHQPFLAQQEKHLDCQLVPIARTFIFPMGLYSRQINNLDKLSAGAIVAIPNDPTNEARALLLLQEAGLISLRKGVSVNATPEDIISNPKQLQFAELDAAQLPRALSDVSLAAINTNFALPAGLSPQKDALFAEDSSSMYANLIVVRKQDANNLKNANLVAAYHSPEVVAAANKIFGGGAIPAW